MLQECLINQDRPDWAAVLHAQAVSALSELAVLFFSSGQDIIHLVRPNEVQTNLFSDSGLDLCDLFLLMIVTHSDRVELSKGLLSEPSFCRSIFAAPDRVAQELKGLKMLFASGDFSATSTGDALLPTLLTICLRESEAALQSPVESYQPSSSLASKLLSTLQVNITLFLVNCYLFCVITTIF